MVYDSYIRVLYSVCVCHIDEVQRQKSYSNTISAFRGTLTNLLHYFIPFFLIITYVFNFSCSVPHPTCFYLSTFLFWNLVAHFVFPMLARLIFLLYGSRFDYLHKMKGVRKKAHTQTLTVSDCVIETFIFSLYNCAYGWTNVI